MKTAHNVTGNLATSLGNIITGSKEATPVAVHHLVYMQDNAGRVWSICSTGVTIGPITLPGGLGNVKFAGGIAQIANLEIQNQVGSQDSKATFDLFPVSENPNVLTYLNELFANINNGVFDLCPVWIYHAWTNAAISAGGGPLLPIGYCIGYGGVFGEAQVSRSKAKITVNSMLYAANLRLPRRLYQPQCSNMLYDAECTINQATHSFTGTINIIDPTLPGESMWFTGNPHPSGYISLGVMKYLSGQNAGLTRLIKSDFVESNGQGFAQLISPWPVEPQIGDQVYISAGCDKSQSTCISKFNNLNNFRGFPWIPIETLYF